MSERLWLEGRSFFISAHCPPISIMSPTLAGRSNKQNKATDKIIHNGLQAKTDADAKGTQYNGKFRDPEPEQEECQQKARKYDEIVNQSRNGKPYTPFQSTAVQRFIRDPSLENPGHNEGSIQHACRNDH